MENPQHNQGRCFLVKLQILFYVFAATMDKIFEENFNFFTICQ